MSTQHYLRGFLLVGLLGTFQQAFAQYTIEKVAIDTKEEYGYVEVCKDCPATKAEKGKVYSYLEEQQLMVSTGSYKGSLLHGKAFLFSKETKAPTLEAEFHLGQYHNRYKQWLTNGEPVADAGYTYGVKHGKSAEFVFGELEAEKVFNKGVLESVTYFVSEGEPASKIDYLSSAGPEKRIKVTSYTPNGLIEAEAILVDEANEQMTIVYDGAYKQFDNNRALLVSGTYARNLKQGEWTETIGDVVNIRRYTKGQLLSESFLKGGQPFTGTVRELYSNNSLKQKISVKNGIRQGETIEYTFAETPLVAYYENGKVVNKTAAKEAGEAHYNLGYYDVAFR